MHVWNLEGNLDVIQMSKTFLPNMARPSIVPIVMPPTRMVLVQDLIKLVPIWLDPC